MPRWRHVRPSRCLAGLVAALAASAFAAVQAADPATADLARGDNALAPDEVLVVEAGDGGRYWSLHLDHAARRAPRYPESLRERGIEGCVAVGFVIDREGVPKGFMILKSGSNQPTQVVAKAFAGAVVDVVRRWRYRPGPENPDAYPGFAAALIGFAIDDGMASTRTDWRGMCAIEDLGAFMRGRGGQQAAGP